MRKNNLTRSIIFVIIAYLGVSLMGVFVKLTSATLPNSEILFFRFSLGLLFLTPLIARDKKFTFSVKNKKYFLLRNLSGLISIMLMFYSLTGLSVSMVITLVNTSSLFIPLLIFAFYREKTPLPILACTVLGFLGVCLILVTVPENTPIQFLFSGLGSAVFAALAYIGIRELSSTQSPAHVVFHFYFFSCVIIIITSSYNWILPNGYELLLLFFVGFTGLLFQFFSTKAFSHPAITLVAPFIFTGVIFSSLCDWLFWGQIPTMRFWGGAAIIIGSTSLMVAYQRKTSRIQSTE